MAVIQPIGKIVSKQTNHVSIFEKNVRHGRYIKNGEGMFGVLRDDMDRYGLLTVD